MEIIRPIFLVGFPRSGTTYLQSLIATQAGIVSLPETHFYTVLTGHISNSEVFMTTDLPDILERAERMMELQLDLNEMEALEADERGVPRKVLFEWLLQKLCEKQGVSPPSAENRLLEKTPSHAWYLDQIKADYPDAIILHITRHPLDSISSHIFKLSKGKRSLSHLIQDWKRAHDMTNAFRSKHPNDIFTVRYEDVRTDTARSMARVMHFLEMDLDESTLKEYPIKAKELIMSFETWKAGNTEEGLETDDTDLELNWKQKATIQNQLGAEMKLEGYDLRSQLIQTIYNIKNGTPKR